MPHDEYRYNSCIFGVPKKKGILIQQIDSGNKPAFRENIMVYNIGRTEVYVEIKHGTNAKWEGTISAATIKPREKLVVKFGETLYYVTAVKVWNTSNVRAVVHCRHTENRNNCWVIKEPGTFDENKNIFLKHVFPLGVKDLPYLGAGLSGIISVFWPHSKPNLWEQIYDKVMKLVNRKVLDAINVILDCDLKKCYEWMKKIEIEDSEDLSFDYMILAEYLVGLEKKFIFGSDIPDYENVNQYTLPFYSAVVLLNTMFYVICVQRQSKIGLTDKEIGDIKDYATRAIQGDEGANKYITDMYKERLDSAYTTGYAEDLYDIMMNVRTYIGTQGLEYIPIWNHMLENPTENSTPYNDVISYSTLFGFQTVGMIKEALPEELSQPLTPKLIDGKRNKLAHLDVYFWRRDEESPTKIGGMKIVFENGDTYTIGTVSELVQEIDFDEALLIELEVYSDGAVDCLVFHFSDGRTITCGIEDSGNDFHLAFELEGHHIVSLYMDFEVVEFGDKISNVSVAYQLINDHLLYHQ